MALGGKKSQFRFCYQKIYVNLLILLSHTDLVKLSHINVLINLIYSRDRLTDN